jgi:hypothetical protein
VLESRLGWLEDRVRSDGARAALVALLIVLVAVGIYLGIRPQDDALLPPPEVPEVPPEIRGSQIAFARYAWNVRGDDGPPTTVGGWSRDQVSVRDDGALVLELSRQDGVWQSAEVYTDQQGFGYGTYRWEVESRLDTLDRNVVLGLFTYERGAPGNREVDIEATRWGRDSPANMHATLHIDDERARSADWAIGPQRNTVHAFTWRPGEVEWVTLDEDEDVLFAETMPFEVEPGRERVHMNLWIYGGMPPERPEEIVIRDFSFTPLEG